MEEPVTLADQQATFREDERNMTERCRSDDTAYRPASNGGPAAFPAWQLALFYANP